MALEPYPVVHLIGRSILLKCVGDSSLGLDEVSREHLEILAYRDGSLELVDRRSSNGTFIQQSGTWIRIDRPTPVQRSSRVRVGSQCEFLVEDLLRAAGKPPDVPRSQPSPPVRKVSSHTSRWVRNTQTGEPEQI